MSDSEQRLDWHDPDEFDDWGDLEEDEDDPLEEALATCSMYPYDGVWICSDAGTEWCDWVCPFSSELGIPVDEIPDE